MKRVVVYAHYDAGGRIRRYVHHFLGELRRVCDELWFVSTAELAPAELATVAPVCAQAWIRPNAGYDFGMWQDALSRLQLDDVDELVLTNSSVFAPVHPLAALFRRMDAVDADLWAATENYDETPHLQSYFLVFRRRVLTSRAFAQFWQGVLPYRDKQQVIRSYELGLSRFLVEQGFVLKPAVSLAELFSVEGRSPFCAPLFRAAGNPTCRFPAELIARGLPFVKVETLRDNPFGVRLRPVYRAMERAGFDLSLVEFDRPSR
jgi:lipopolysaccharide biosynthesis protein